MMFYCTNSFAIEKNEYDSNLSVSAGNDIEPLSTGNISGGGNTYFSSPAGGSFTFYCSGNSSKADVRLTVVSSTGNPSYYAQVRYQDGNTLFTIPILTLNGNGVYHFTSYGPNSMGLKAGNYTVTIYSDGASGFSAAAYIEDYYSVYGHN